MKVGSVSLKYAVRSLTRHTRRTLISMMGTGVGCAMALIAMSWMDGSSQLQIQAITESGAGHLRIVHREWLETEEDALRLENGNAVLELVEALPELDMYSVRAQTGGLLAFGTRTAPARITGVIPEKELASNRLLRRGILEGRYLKANERASVVIGKALAKRLDVMVDDDLYATLSGIDDIHSAMLRIVGILDTGSQNLDLTVCQITLGTLEKITGIEGIGEISILLDNANALDRVQEHLQRRAPENSAVITWREVNPSLAANVDSDRAFMRLLSIIIVFVVSLGIMSAQLTGVLERRTEYAMLSALGMKSRQIVFMVLIEAIVIGLGGALIGLAIGGSGAWYLSRTGLNLQVWLDDDLGFADVLLDPVLYGSFGAWIIGYALFISMATTVFATFYPAWKASRVMPADALRTG